MHAILFRQPLKKGYFIWGLAGLLLALVAITPGVEAFKLAWVGRNSPWSISTGALLLGCICYQWRLFFIRAFGRLSGQRVHFLLHRYLGVAVLFLFALHALSYGHRLLLFITAVFLSLCVVGLFNMEIVSSRSLWWRYTWQVVHVGLAALLMPFLIFHVWAALAFK